jgi:phosphate transport system permease protein
VADLAAPTLADRRDDVPLLTLERCALLYGLEKQYHGLADFMLANGVTVEPDGNVALDPRVREWARPVQLVVSPNAITATDGDEIVWSSPVDALTGVVHRGTDPVSVISARDVADCTVLVPPADATSFRTAMRRVLEPAPGQDGEMAPADRRPQPRRRQLKTVRGLGDSFFRSGSWAAGLSVLAIMVLVGGFLLWLALPALQATGFSFLTTAEWQPDVHHFGIAAVLTFTILIAVVALIVAVPLAIGTALFISEIVPRPLKQTSIAMVDLMAAVPSVVYGMWGRVILQDHAIGVSRFLATWFSWIPFFKVDGSDPRNPLGSATVYTASTFIAGVCVALMVIPITCSIMREVFSQAPAGEREGAYALGSTRWGMIRSVVLPFGKGGMIGAVMLGLGRALGETVAVYLIISPVFNINFHILQSGSNSVSSLIVLRQGDASGFGRSALLAAGLALFVITLLVNFTASSIVARTRSGAQSEA